MGNRHARVRESLSFWIYPVMPAAHFHGLRHRSYSCTGDETKGSEPAKRSKKKHMKTQQFQRDETQTRAHQNNAAKMIRLPGRWEWDKMTTLELAQLWDRLNEEGNRLGPVDGAFALTLATRIEAYVGSRIMEKELRQMQLNLQF